jgi:translation initiation factor IF-3
MVVGKEVVNIEAMVVGILPTGEAVEVAEATTMQVVAITPTVRATRLMMGGTQETFQIQRHAL